MRARERIVRSSHPMLAAREVRVGEWWMVDEGGTRYRIIVSLHVGTDDGPRPCYRVVSGESEGRRLIGYFPTLKAACEAAHRTYVAETGPGMWSQYGQVDPGPRAVYPLAAVEFGRLAGTNNPPAARHTT
jgi:hypothetical protein